MHCGAEVTESSTNKQHHLTLSRGGVIKTNHSLCPSRLQDGSKAWMKKWKTFANSVARPSSSLSPDTPVMGARWTSRTAGSRGSSHLSRRPSSLGLDHACVCIAKRQTPSRTVGRLLHRYRPRRSRRHILTLGVK